LARASIEAASTALASDVEAARLAAGAAPQFGEQLIVDVGGDDARAFANEGLRSGPADTLAGGGDEGGLALEAVGHCRLRSG
jgi:hypothetical protein